MNNYKNESSDKKEKIFSQNIRNYDINSQEVFSSETVDIENSIIKNDNKGDNIYTSSKNLYHGKYQKEAAYEIIKDTSIVSHKKGSLMLIQKIIFLNYPKTKSLLIKIPF